MNVLEKLIFYWNYPFVRYALIVGVLIALCSSLLGVTLVLKRFSFIGDGLSHVAFGGMAIATVLGMSDHMPLTLAVTVACAVLLLHTGQNTQIKGDAAIAMVSVGALAMGYLLMNLFSTSANLSGDVCSTLFGSTSILTLTKSEVWLCIGLSIIVVAVFMLFYNKIFAVTFDETFAQAVGTNANGYNLLIAIVIAVIIGSDGLCKGFIKGDCTGDFSGSFGDAPVQEFPRCHHLLGGIVRELCLCGHRGFRPGRNAGWFDHCCG